MNSPTIDGHCDQSNIPVYPPSPKIPKKSVMGLSDEQTETLIAKPSGMKIETPNHTRSLAGNLQTSRMNIPSFKSASMNKKINLKSTPSGASTSSKKSAITYVLFTWKIPCGSIQPLHMYYHLERTSRFIEHSNPSDIAIRISECLRQRSIFAFYHSTKAKVKCCTAKRVEFRIRIFADNDNGNIVEVQRRSGNSVAFRRDCQAILNAAEGDCENIFAKSVSSIPCFPPKKSSDSHYHMLGADYDTASGKHEIAQVEVLLGNDRLDTKILGMQYLCSLTDSPKSVSEQVALRNSLTVLFSDDALKIRHFIIDLVQHRRYLCQENEIEAFPADYLDHLQELALKVCTNAMDVMAKKGLLSQALKQHTWAVDELVEPLVIKLKESITKPHVASLAVKCLQRLMEASPEALKKAVKLDIAVLVGEAMEIGKTSHAQLALETENCAIALGCF